MKIKQIKVSSYNDFSKYKNDIYECLNRNYNKKIDMWLSDSPAQNIVLDCRNGYSFSFAYYYDVRKTDLADLYALIFFEKDRDEEVPGFEFYTYSDHKIEIIADGVALTVTPIECDVYYNAIWQNKILSKFITDNALMVPFYEQNEFVCKVYENTPFNEVNRIYHLMKPYLVANMEFQYVYDLKDAKKNPNILTLVKQPLDSEFEYIVYLYMDNDFCVVEKFPRSHMIDLQVYKTRDHMAAKVEEIVKYINDDIHTAAEQSDVTTVSAKVIEMLQKIIKEG